MITEIVKQETSHKNNNHLLFYLVNNKDSFRELGGNDELLKCLEKCEELQKDVVLRVVAKVVDENGKPNKTG